MLGGGRYFSGGGVGFFVVVSGSILTTLITGTDFSVVRLGVGGGGAGVVGRGVVVGLGVEGVVGLGVGGGVGLITGGGIGFLSAGIIMLLSSPRQPSGKKYRIF